MNTIVVSPELPILNDNEVGNYSFTYKNSGSQDSAVGAVTGYGLDD